ncbi:LysR family transcriptional regulator [Zoogloeaceae bacterium G21618-S1]|nr:LysR family transcriptional regulator [Zoogloeaceae bacterium G21618-S1]
MASLNYKHLRYFWAVAKAGSIVRAAESLHLTPHAISSQITALEASLGAKLFEREGRRLILSVTGKRILAHAETIFSLGDEILDIVGDPAARDMQPLRIGISDSVPKAVAYRLVSPALRLDDPVKLTCREGRLDALLADLAIHRLDLVIADRPMPARLSVRGFNHLLGESALSVMASTAVRQAHSGPFPGCLDHAPFLMPGEDTAIHAPLSEWFDRHGIRPRVIAEFDDSALLKAFGQAGAGFFAAPSATNDYVCRQYGVEVVGQIDEVIEQLYAITTEGKLTRPEILAIQQAARQEIFGPPAPRSKTGRRGSHVAG